MSNSISSNILNRNRAICKKFYNRTSRNCPEISSMTFIDISYDRAMNCFKLVLMFGKKFETYLATQQFIDNLNRINK